MIYGNRSTRNIASTLRGASIILLAAVVTLVSTARVAHASAAAGQPDVFVLVYEGSNGDDSVAMTYPTAIPHTRAKSDLQALAATTGWNPTHIEIDDAKAPVRGAKDMMTSVAFVAHGVIPAQGRYLPLEPVITALRNYPHLAITYMLSDKLDFAGLREYNDKYVSVALDARGNAYTYHVHIHDRSFQKLNLPLYQLPPSQTKTASAGEPRPRVRPWQVMLVTLLACLAGGTVYFIMSRNAPA